MKEPVWIDREAVMIAHARQLREHGGQQGVRDFGLLDSALNRPRHLWAYADPKPDAAALAASYAVGIAKNHPFYDGNKRAAAVVCEAFLSMLGCVLDASDDEWADAIIAVAAGELPEDEFAQWLRDHLSTDA